MIVLYHCVSARSFRPLCTLEELGVPYELRMLPFPPRALARSYLALNPLGTAPLLEDGATHMTESAAMCQYLPERCDPGNARGLSVRPHEADYGAYLNWLHHGEATLTFPQTIVLRYDHFELDARKLPQAADDYAKWFLARLRGIDAVLTNHEFLCADRFTGADISVAYALMLGEHLGLLERFPCAVQNYWARLQQREGFRCALAVQQAKALAQGISTVPSPDMRPN